MEPQLRLYLGKLDSRVEEDVLMRLFQEHGLNPTNIQLKRGYAFVDCPDQITFDRAIDTFNGFNLMGSVMQVEPSMSKPRGRRNTRVIIQNLPAQVDKDNIDHLVGTFGSVQRCETLQSGSENKVIITYETPEQASTAVDQLNGFEFHGVQLKVEIYTQNGQKQRGPRPQNQGAPVNQRVGSGYPLRILVPSDDVGAIIGRGGQTIRGITTECKTRVDVHRKDTPGMLEKVISIYGTPENCSRACKAILKIRTDEAQESNRPGEIILKVLADDRFCGRIIGKGGNTIKKIKDETNARVSVSKNYSYAYRTGEGNLSPYFPDRVVTIRGNEEEMVAGESIVSSILRECHEKDMQQPMGGHQGPDMMMQSMQHMMMPPQGGMYGMTGAPHYSMMGGGRGNYYPTNPMYGGAMQPPMQRPQQQQQDIVQSDLFIPNSFVGAIIGTGGSSIKKIMRDSGAFVSILPGQKSGLSGSEIDTKKENEPNPAADRTVTIKGTPEAQWKAGFYIFSKLKQEGFAGNDEVRLRSAIQVPNRMVGRVIGKRGKNVRETQRTTGAMVKVPTASEHQQTQGEMVPVEVFGTFHAIQHAQAKVRQQASEQGPVGPQGAPQMMYPPPPRGRGPRNNNQQQQAPPPQPQQQQQ